MTNEIIHIKIDRSEAIGGKRELLTSEESLVKISRSIANYTPLRISELSERDKLSKKVSELKKILTKLEKTLPKVKVPKILRRKVEEIHNNKEVEKAELQKEVKNLSLEEELAEIQKKLRKLGAK